MSYFNPRTNRVTNYRNDPGDTTTVINPSVYALLQDVRNEDGFWVGTFGGGLDYFDSNRRLFGRVRGKIDQPDLIGQNVNGLMYDCEDNLWALTNSGVSRLRWSNGTYEVEAFVHDENDLSTISSNAINAGICDSKAGYGLQPATPD